MGRPLIVALVFAQPLALSAAAADETPPAQLLSPFQPFTGLRPSGGLRALGGNESSGEAEFSDRQIYYNIRVDKLEAKPRNGRTGYEWDAQAWIGTDYEKIFIKTEGFNNGGAAPPAENGQVERWENLEFQVLYSRMISYFWDIQIGVRHNVYPKPERTYAVLGFEGLAPGFLEVDAQAFLSEKGEISGRLNVFHDILITNRLILQPRFDINVSAQQVPELSLGAGFTELELSARLRYEFSRQFAPYMGVSWESKLGETAAIARRKDEPVSRVYFVGGLRLNF